MTQLYFKEKLALSYHGLKGQLNCLKTIDANDLIFITGPAGTGKTFLSIVYAMSAYKKGKVEKIILCRPAVEAGENLGFLPGDLKEKIDPYLTPLYDSLEKIIPKNNLKNLLSNKIIEIMPLHICEVEHLKIAF